MPTSYPKCSPTEVMGLLVLLESHKGAEDVARLADDLDLEIDEILPALEYAELLQLVKVADGHVTFTDLGRRFSGASIRERKSLLREQLRRTTLFKTLLNALDAAPEHRLSEEQLAQLLSLTPALVDEALQTIVNWGRYAELFRFNSEQRELVGTRRASASRSGPGHPPPPGGSAERAARATRTTPTTPTDPPAPGTGVAPATA